MLQQILTQPNPTTSKPLLTSYHAGFQCICRSLRSQTAWKNNNTDVGTKNIVETATIASDTERNLPVMLTIEPHNRSVTETSCILLDPVDAETTDRLGIPIPPVKLRIPMTLLAASKKRARNFRSFVFPGLSRLFPAVPASSCSVRLLASSL